MIRLALLVLANVAGSAFCSLTEAALLASSEARILGRVQLGQRGAERLLRIRRDPGPTLSSIVFLNNVFAVAGTAYITSLATEIVPTAWGLAAFIGLETVVIIAFGEIAPKLLGEALPEPIAGFCAPVLVVVRRLMAPLTTLVKLLTFWARPRSRVESGGENEIRHLARLGQEGGHLDPGEADLIHRVFRLDDITAEDVMTPRRLVNGFPADRTLLEARPRLLESNHSQFPVYENDLDAVVGVLWLKEALGALVRGEGERTVREVMRPAKFVPPSRAVDDVFQDLQSGGRRMLVVIDEYGSTMGIVTIDDLVEELVGEAIDETDVSAGLVKRVSRTSAIVHGLTRVRDVARFLKCTPPDPDSEEETSTVAGLLQERLERIPVKGDLVELPGGLLLEVREADGRMATRVLARNTARVPSEG